MQMIYIICFFSFIIFLVIAPGIVKEKWQDKKVSKELEKLKRLPNTNIDSEPSHIRDALKDYLQEIRFCGGIELCNSRIRYENNIWSIDPNQAGKFIHIEYALAQNYIIACIKEQFIGHVSIDNTLHQLTNLDQDDNYDFDDTQHMSI